MIQSLTILIVDDNYIYAKDLSKKLKAIGYTNNVLATSAEEALRLIETATPDLAILEISLDGHDMEDISGIKLADELRQQLQLPIIFLTRHQDNRILNATLKVVPDGYLVKGAEDVADKLAREVALTMERYWYQKKKVTLLTTTMQGTLCLRATRQNVMINGERVKLDGWVKLEISDLIMIQADGNYCKVYYCDQDLNTVEQLYINGILKEFEKQLSQIDATTLVRCSRYHIVNLCHLKFINSDNKFLVMDYIKRPVEMGNLYKPQVMSKLQFLKLRK